MMINKSQQIAGFTLLEVLAAFVILALAFATLMQSLSGSINKTVHSKEYTEVALWAKSKMAEIGNEIEIEELSDAGEFNEQYKWQLNIEPYELDDDNTNAIATTHDLYKVELIISWEQRNQKLRETKFSTLRLASPGKN